MLNGDGNENGKKKKSVGVIGEKKNILCTCRTLFCTFLCRCCSNVKLSSSTSYGENVVVACVAVRLFFHCPSFLPCLFRFLIFSPPVSHVALPTKFVSSVFLSLASRSLSLFFSLSSASLSPTLSFLFVDIKIHK